MSKTNTTTTPQSPSIVLWGVGLSPYVRKVQIALEEKKIRYEHRQILPKALLIATAQPVPDDFDKASPLGKIPALQIGDYCIADSAVISAYLDKKFPQEQQLYPDNAEAYARALWFENYADTILSSISHHKIFAEAVVKPKIFGTAPNQEILEKATSQELPPCLDYLEKEVGKHEWLAGDDFSMADAAIVAQLIGLDIAGFDLAKTRWANLVAYKEKVMGRESLKRI